MNELASQDLGTQEHDNDRPSNRVSSFIAGCWAAAIIIAVLFFTPWRFPHSESVVHSPVYRTPRKYVGNTEFARTKPGFVYEDGAISYSRLLLEAAGVSFAFALVYAVAKIAELPAEE
jgi:hypothetical protein